MKIGIFGAGYVGLVTGACLAELGHEVICVEKDQKKLVCLQAGQVPIVEEGLDELLKRNRESGRIHFTESSKEAVESSKVLFICVGTPSLSDGSTDLSFVLQVAREIGFSLGNDFTLVVDKSTVPVGTGENVTEAIKQVAPSASFEVASNPEFLKEGTAVKDFMEPDRIVVGVESEEALNLMKEVYAPLIERGFPFIVTNRRTAELIKYAANAFLATKITFANSIARLCDGWGVDVLKVMEGIGLDSRIGRAFLNPGPGFGGSCFPKDVKSLVYEARKTHRPQTLLEEVLRVNEQQIEYVVDSLAQLLGGLRGKKIAALGLAFKKGTDDVRESPALKMVNRLKQEGAEVKAYDPKASGNALKVLPWLKVCSSIEETLQDAEGVLILTEWDEFKGINWREAKKRLKREIIYDTRNILFGDELQKLGYVYQGMGRK